MVHLPDTKKFRKQDRWRTKESIKKRKEIFIDLPACKSISVIIKYVDFIRLKCFYFETSLYLKYTHNWVVIRNISESQIFSGNYIIRNR